MDDEFVSFFEKHTQFKTDKVISNMFSRTNQFSSSQKWLFSLINTFLLLLGYDTHRRYES